MTDQARLIEAARSAAGHSICGFSGFRVGAALQAPDGTVFSGCNIENATLSLSLCAERVALFKALSEGHREFTALAITTLASSGESCPPCGACRQLLWEFAPEVTLLLAGGDGSVEELTIADLFPRPFDSGCIEPG